MKQKSVFLALALVFLLIILPLFNGTCLISRPPDKKEADADLSHLLSIRSAPSVKIEEANSRLNGNTSGIPCGTPDHNVDCYRNYDVSDIILSSDAGNDVEERAQYEKNLEERHAVAKTLCASGAEYTGTGGWCLDGTRAKEYVNFESVQVPIPANHVPASEGIVKVLGELMTEKNITCLNDFGAGVGQYKGALLKKYPNFDYRAYDGAGNIEEYTKGMVKYFDLTLPLALPKADFVLSLEVGEHVHSSVMMTLSERRHAECVELALSGSSKNEA